jgi:hypothetical protein
VYPKVDGHGPSFAQAKLFLLVTVRLELSRRLSSNHQLEPLRASEWIGGETYDYLLGCLEKSDVQGETTFYWPLTKHEVGTGT